MKKRFLCFLQGKHHWNYIYPSPIGHCVRCGKISPKIFNETEYRLKIVQVTEMVNRGVKGARIEKYYD